MRRITAGEYNALLEAGMSESEHQIRLFAEAEKLKSTYPELRLLYHIPNGGLRNKATATRLVAEGVRKGVPDICLPVARNGYHGLYIELKRLSGGTVSLEQKEWLELLTAEGYKAVVCRGWRDARSVIEEYLKTEDAT